MYEIFIMDVFEDKIWVTWSRMDSDYKEYLNAFLDYAFTNSALVIRLHAHVVCGNRFHYEREVIRCYLLIEGWTLVILNMYGFIMGANSIESDNEDDDDMSDDQFDHGNHGSFKHEIHDMIVMLLHVVNPLIIPLSLMKKQRKFLN